MARKAIDIVADVKRKVDKEMVKFQKGPYFWAHGASELCNPDNYVGNNKSEWIKKLALAAAYLLCEIETIQAIKGDGIYK